MGALRIQGKGQPKCPAQPRDSSQFFMPIGPNVMHSQEREWKNYEKINEPFFAFLLEISQNSLR